MRSTCASQPSPSTEAQPEVGQHLPDTRKHPRGASAGRRPAHKHKHGLADTTTGTHALPRRHRPPREAATCPETTPSPSLPGAPEQLPAPPREPPRTQGRSASSPRAAPRARPRTPGITGLKPRCLPGSAGAATGPAEGRAAHLIASAPARAARSDWPPSAMGRVFSQWARGGAVTRCPGRGEPGAAVPGGARGCCGHPGPPPSLPPAGIPASRNGPVCRQGSRRDAGSPRGSGHAGGALCNGETRSRQRAQGTTGGNQTSGFSRNRFRTCWVW